MALDPILTLPSIKAELEAGWKLFDDLFATFTPSRWARKFGKTWIYADIPYHLAYFDRMIAKSLEDGSNAPEHGRMHMKSMGEMHAWNADEFRKRPAGQTVEQSLAQMREARDRLRRLLGRMTEADLDTPCWMPLIFGWGPARGIARAVIIHNVAEYWKVWIRTGKKTPAPSPASVHARLAFMMEFMPASLNRAEAAKGPFTAVWNFVGPGGGAWTFRVRNGACAVTEEMPAEKPDVMITMKPETFHRIVAKMTPPPLLMLGGQMRVKGLAAMGRFGKLFPEPKPDEIIEPTGTTGATG